MKTPSFSKISERKQGNPSVNNKTRKKVFLFGAHLKCFTRDAAKTYRQHSGIAKNSIKNFPLSEEMEKEGRRDRGRCGGIGGVEGKNGRGVSECVGFSVPLDT